MKIILSLFGINKLDEKKIYYNSLIIVNNNLEIIINTENKTCSIWRIFTF